jgi:hypothetical protein
MSGDPRGPSIDLPSPDAQQPTRRTRDDGREDRQYCRPPECAGLEAAPLDENAVGRPNIGHGDTPRYLIQRISVPAKGELGGNLGTNARVLNKSPARYQRLSRLGPTEKRLPR